jgi:hypothetical protein
MAIPALGLFKKRVDRIDDGKDQIRVLLDILSHSAPQAKSTRFEARQFVH